MTINEDENGLCEVFTTIGKAGGNAAAQSEAISRLISLALRSGIEPREIVKQLKGISGPTPVWDGHGGQILTTPDAIGKVLEHYIENRDEMWASRAHGHADQHSPSAVPATPGVPTTSRQNRRRTPEYQSDHLPGVRVNGRSRERMRPVPQLRVEQVLRYSKE